MTRYVPALAAVIAAAGVLTGCGGGSGSAGPSTSASTTSTPSSPASASTPVTTSPTSPASPSRPAAKARTAAELKKALMELADLPSGFAIEPDEGDGDGSTVSSKNARCAPLVRLMNVDSPPGSRANSARSFSGGQQGPYIDEQLDAMGSAKAVADLQRAFRAAVASCRAVTIRIPGQGSSTVMVRQASAPLEGTGPVAVRLTATSGALDGLEITMVTTGIDDVVLALTFVAAVPDDVDGATGTAVEKAKRVLAVGGSGT